MNEIFEFVKVSVEDAAKAVPAPDVRLAAGDWARLRAPEPPAVLAPQTIDWLASLPADIAPRELARAFARVANTLCDLWKRPSRCEVYLSRLILDDRRGRAGFPSAVLKELGKLAAHYAELYPARGVSWGDVRKR